ncbi:polysaccharide deacetylase family protein [Sphaerisporangium sp. NPDC088356]|uniref:polysaccharide deacetylase family protein n=1 Tax=Sphaerisporangium sp. NPDC088356 TaxID=3154871 RepID=UPI003413E781
MLSLTAMSRLLRSGGIALLVAITAGCGVAFPFEDEPTTLPAQPTTINFVAPSAVGGLSAQTISDESGDRHVFVSYPSIASAPELAEKLRQTTSATVRRFSKDTHARPKALAPPELNVGWQLTAASGGVFGVRMRTGLFTGDQWRNSLGTLWYDQDARRVHDSADLLKDGHALVTLAAIVQNRLWTLGPDMKVDAVKPDRAMFDSLNFNPHGDLVAEFDDGQVAPARMGRIAVAVPKQEAAPLLSDFGRRTMEVVDSATPGSIPGTPPPESPPAPGDPGVRGTSVNCAATRCVALTFDDGPGPQTDRLLAILAEYDARATFFTVGANAEAQPALLRRIIDAGHLIANHSWSHRDLATLDIHKISDELSRTQMMIGTVGPAPALLRAPYGGVTAKVVTVARALKLSIVGWSLDTADARDPDPAAVARRAIDGAHPGSVILMHDGGPATLAALPKLLKGLAARGYAFVSVPELYGSRGMEPGQVYGTGTAAPAH